MLIIPELLVKRIEIVEISLHKYIITNTDIQSDRLRSWNNALTLFEGTKRVSST